METVAVEVAVGCLACNCDVSVNFEVSDVTAVYFVSYQL